MLVKQRRRRQQGLCVSPLSNGDFISFAEKEFGFQNKMTIYEHLHVAERLGDKVSLGLPYNWKTARELARPSTSDIIIEQVIDGQIDATPEAIRQARKEEAIAKQALLESEELNKHLQTTFGFYKQNADQKEHILNARIDDLQKERDLLSQTRIEIQEKEVIPPATLEHIDKLEAELKERTRQRDYLAERGEKLGQELDEQRDANEARREQELYEYKINERVKKICSEWGRTTVQLLGLLPSPIESQVVTGDNWALIDHDVDMTQRFIETVKRIKIEKQSLVIHSD